jgi:hypothetical protein
VPAGPRECRKLGSGLNPHRRQLGARGEADAPGLVVQTEAVFAPAVGGQPEGQWAQLEGDGKGHLVGKEAGLLQPSQEGLREIPVPREVESVDARSQFLDI